jgi:nitroreductase
MISELIKKNRSYRRYDASREISREQLLSFVENARFVASAANLQRLRFTAVNDKESCDKIFSSLKFAGYLKEWSGPAPEERPAAYIIVSSKAELDGVLGIDIGIAAEAITLAAAEVGVGACMFRSYDAEVISRFVPSEEQKPHLVISLGYPTERVYLTDSENGNIKYYRDEKDDHAVPKLTLDELLLG